MRDLTDKFKLSFRSVGEVVELVSAMVLRMRTRGLTYGPGGRALSREVFGNAVFCWLSHQPVEVQERVVREGLVFLGEFLGVAVPSASASPELAATSMTAGALDGDGKGSGSKSRNRGV